MTSARFVMYFLCVSWSTFRNNLFLSGCCCTSNERGVRVSQMACFDKCFAGGLCL